MSRHLFNFAFANGEGKVTLYDVANALDADGYAMAMTSDGSIFIAGQSAGDFAIAKFDSTGSPERKTGRVRFP